MSYFSINARGLTGDKADIDLVVDAYKASYEKVATESAVGYLYNHSDYVYVIDQKGMVRYLIRQEDKPEHIVKIVKQLL
jgi:cytochrome oxidase Cu insertion factor (SCO1/SenC/PrrC family)